MKDASSIGIRTLPILKRWLISTLIWRMQNSRRRAHVMEKKKWLTTEYPEIIFEDNTVGRLRKKSGMPRKKKSTGL